MAKKIVGIMVCGSGEKRLLRVLEQRKLLVDDMVVCLNGASLEDENLIKKFGWAYRDDREWGKDQPRIKQDLVQKAGKLNPDWILAADADEIFDKRFTREEAEKLMKPEVLAYEFNIVNLWDDEEHFNHTRGFWNVRFWNYRFAKEISLAWSNKPVHCGLAPVVCYKYAHHAPFFVKHYGLMLPEDRRVKVERYKKYDPNSKFKSKEYYDSIDDSKETRDLIRPFDEDEWHERVARDVEKHPSKPQYK